MEEQKNEIQDVKQGKIIVGRLVDPSNNVPDEEKAKEISKELFEAIASQKTAPAVSANQIGLDEKMIAVVAREPLYLINPKIIQADQPFVYVEAHSSYPNELFTTLRFASITVEADNLKESVRFGLPEKEMGKLYKNGKLNMVLIQHPIVMECCYIQQTVDTMNGMHPLDRQPKLPEPVVKDKEPGRNQIVTLVKGNEEMKLKYKKATEYLEDGWELKSEE